MNVSTIAFRLNALFLLIITAVLLVSGGINYVRSKAEREAAVDRQVTAALARLSSSLPSPLWAFDKGQIQQILGSEMAEPAIAGIVIRNGQKVLGGTDRADDGKARPATEAPKLHDGERVAKLAFVENNVSNPVGEALVYVSFHEIKAALRQDLMWTVAQILALDAILVLALSRGLTVVVLRPLARVREALHNIADGEADLTKRLPGSEVAEFKDVSETFNAFMTRLQGVIGQVRQGSDSLAVASRQIAAGNQDLSNRTEHQASALEQTAASMEELTNAVKLNTDNARQANSMAQAARDVAVKGGDVVGQVIGTMNSINASSTKIVDIISVIDGIAFQTNILALNAAVEAARAGEQGRGFAVVAAEVRSLAQRSASAAKEISALIGDSVQRVGTGTKLVDEAGSTMQEVVTGVKRVTDLMGEILSATQEQMNGIQQVNQAIKDMDTVTQKNAALVEEAAAAAESMQDQTASLNQVVSAFRIAA